jgi:hypothetical protein
VRAVSSTRREACRNLYRRTCRTSEAPGRRLSPCLEVSPAGGHVPEGLHRCMQESASQSLELGWHPSDLRRPCLDGAAMARDGSSRLAQRMKYSASFSSSPSFWLSGRTDKLMVRHTLISFIGDQNDVFFPICLFYYCRAITYDSRDDLASSTQVQFGPQ